MASTNDQKYLLVTLFSGNSYEEENRRKGNYDTHPMTRVTFKSQLIRFDLSTFKLSRTNEDLFKDNWQMLNFRQLTYAIDSLNKKFNQRKSEMVGDSKLYFTMLRDSGVLKNIPSSTEMEDPEVMNGKVSVNSVMEIALSAARNLKTYFENNADEIESKKTNITRFTIEWHRKFTLSIACFVLFLIGAPLGAIIRKGGLGMPIVVSIIFFLFFHVTSIIGEKFAKEGVIPPDEGMWIAPLVLLPIGIFLTYKATKDSALLDVDGYLNFFRKLKRKKAV
jgi:lipopolysaccharide export system permease protein